MTDRSYLSFVARFVARCGAPEGGCATTPLSGGVLWRTPTAQRWFVAQFVAHVAQSRRTA